MPAESLETEDVLTAKTGALRSMPILLLNVHENCNCKCVMCDIWKRPAGSELKVHDILRHQASLRALGVRQVVLTGGEPLLHSDLSTLCTVLKECGVVISLLTTGLLVQQRADCIAQWMDEIIISLDGPEDVHNNIRQVRRGFELIGKGIVAVRQRRSDMRIQARSTVQRANFRFLRETVKAAKQLSFDSISFLAADVASQAFNRELVWPGKRQCEVALSASDVALLENEIESLIIDFKREIEDRFIVERPDKLRRIVRHFRAQLGQLPPLAPTCNAPWVSAVIEVDGSVRPCFFHPRVGNITNVSLQDAVNTEDAIRFRQTLDVASNPVCQRCVCSLNYQGPNVLARQTASIDAP